MSETQTAQWVPTRYGEGYKASTVTGGHCTLKRLGPESTRIQQGAANLSQAEFTAYQRAVLVASPLNGADWAAARTILEAAGFQVYNI
jgi:hypothetical protein